jgi:hypothetical protein
MSPSKITQVLRFARRMLCAASSEASRLSILAQRSNLAAISEDSRYQYYSLNCQPLRRGLLRSPRTRPAQKIVRNPRSLRTLFRPQAKGLSMHQEHHRRRESDCPQRQLQTCITPRTASKLVGRTPIRVGRRRREAERLLNLKVR